MPYGWEKVEDAEYGTFYIDHINKQTTYENPLITKQQLTTTNSSNTQMSASSMKTFKPSSSSDINKQQQLVNDVLPPPQHQQQQQQPPSNNSQNVYFTRNPAELKGEFITTKLQKTANGFGFTIIGANEIREDFLQIKYIVPNGSAFMDNVLKQGDILVFVNNECVLGYTHSDVVEMFQSISIGDFVEITVNRGYPLTIDPNDPNIEIKPLPPAIQQQQQQQHQLSEEPLSLIDDYHDLYVNIIKGPNGFGFTIADDSMHNQQKVKQILDKERCVRLCEGDILCEINGIELNNLNHNQVVDILTKCIKGQETIIKLKRKKQTLDKGVTNDFKPIQLKHSASNSGLQSSTTTTTQKQNSINTNSTTINNNNEFEYERRSKTPNPIPTSSFKTNNSNNVNEIRSKTPTIDRYITSPNQLINQQQQQQPQMPITQSNSNDNYYYLASNSNNNIVGNASSSSQMQQPQLHDDYTPYQSSKSSQKQQQQPQMPISISSGSIVGTGYPHDLYSTVTPKSQQQQQQYQQIPIEIVNNGMYNNNNNNNNNTKPQTTTSHPPVPPAHSSFDIDLETNNHLIKQQHQKYIKNKYDTNVIRSKTPGPEMFRQSLIDSNNFPPSQQQQQQFNEENITNQFRNTQITSPGKYNTITGNTVVQRSKTPTADMCYPYKQRSATDRIDSAGVGYFEPPFMSNNNRSNKPTILPLQQNVFNNDVEYKYIDDIIELHRHDNGFGFRIVGGKEEGSQVAIGYIVPNGAADLDARLKPNDEIIMIDNENVIGASHKRVVQLMTIAGFNRKVKLWIRRRVPIILGEDSYPYTITLNRNDNEGFGFVIISTLNKNGPTIGDINYLHPYSWIGKIVENSPAARCGRLKIGDRILAVNNINITNMNHVDIVKLIKESGNSITLTIGAPIDEPIALPQQSTHSPNQQMYNYEALPPPAPMRSDSRSQMMTTMIQNANNSRPLLTPTQDQYLQSYNPVPPPPTLTNTTKTINQNEYHLIELRKPSNTGFGFSIRGGKEFNIPIFVLKLADSGIAAIDGRLRVGDQILEINGFDAYNMEHSEAIERIKSGGNIVSLLVRRTGLPPPSITDIIAATNSVAASSSQAHSPINATNSRIINQPQILTQQQQPSIGYNQSDSTLLRPKSPYINEYTLAQQQYQQQQNLYNQQQQQQYYYQQQQQQQSRLYNSSSVLTNRNF